MRYSILTIAAFSCFTGCNARAQQNIALPSSIDMATPKSLATSIKNNPFTPLVYRSATSETIVPLGRGISTH